MLPELIITPEVMTVTRSPLVTVGYLFQLFLSLLMVVGLIFFCAKYLLPKLNISTKGQILQIEDRVGLEPQVTAYILSAFDKKYIVAVSSKSVTLLDKIEG